MTNFGEAPVRKAETFSLETPEEADARLEKQYKSPKSVEDDVQEFIQSAEAQVALDREKTHAVLEQIKNIPTDDTPDRQEVIEQETLPTPASVPSDSMEKQGIMSKVGIFMKRFLGRKLSPEEESYKLQTLRNTFDEAVSQGNLDTTLKAYKSLNDERFQKKISEAQFSEYQEKIDDLTKKAVTSGDEKTFDKVLNFNMANLIDNGPSFTREELGLKDGEAVDPRISEIAMKYLADIIKGSFKGNFNNGLSNYAERLERWVASGVVSTEMVNESPLVKKLMKKEIIDTAKLMFSEKSTLPDPNARFESYLDTVSQAGVYSKEEARSFVKM